MHSNEVVKDIPVRDLNILIAEDIDSNYLLVKSILKNNNVARAANGAEAIKLARDNKYGIILMDLKMPVVDGLEATREIRKFDKDTIIIALTAYAFDSDRNDAIAAGCNNFISKPLKREIGRASCRERV